MGSSRQAIGCFLPMPDRTIADSTNKERAKKKSSRLQQLRGQERLNAMLRAQVKLLPGRACIAAYKHALQRPMHAAQPLKATPSMPR